MKLEGKGLVLLIWLIAIALAAEIFAFNFSFWKSLFYGEKIVFQNMVTEGGERTKEGTEEYIVQEGTLTVYISQVNREVHNLFFDMEFSDDEVIPYTVSLTDEGNYYPYALPENQIAVGTPRSFYNAIYPAGKISGVTVQFHVSSGSVVKVKEIAANVHIPFVFHIERVLVVLGVGLLILGMRRYSMGSVGKIQPFITAAVILLLMALTWKIVHVNPIAIASPWPHHKQYQELAQALSKGQLYLDIEPSEQLLNVRNPYDTIYLQANGIDYRADYAYFDGKYYVYFGVVPELLLYLPCYLLTGHHFPNYMAVYLFYCGFILTVFALYKEVIRRWFTGTPYAVYLLLSVMTVLCGNYLTIAIRPDLYHAPIMAATMFTVGGLWLWLKGKYEEEGKRAACFLLGSLCMALVAGCRPQMLLFSFLAIPLFWEEVMETRKLFSKGSLRDTLCICMPYVVVAVGIMYYNAARFSSPFDFGATYSLTSNDMTKRSFHIHQTLLGLWHYFFQPSFVGSDFPFLKDNRIVSLSYMGKLNTEYTYGGILACNAVTWVLLLINRRKAAMKQKGIYAFVVTNLMISAALGIVDVTGAGILQRYMADMIWGVWFASVLLLFLLAEKAKDSHRYSMLASALVLVFLLQAAYGLGVVFGNGDLSVNVKASNPQLYYHIKYLFMF